MSRAGRSRRVMRSSSSTGRARISSLVYEQGGFTIFYRRLEKGDALQEIQKLYTIERICKEQALNYAEVKEVRQLKSVRILRDLGLWLQQQYVQALPKSLIGEAIAYSLKRWQRLSAYVNDGRLNIDNNPVENSIRPVALGRKNYLFAGSHEAAKRSAMLYSLPGAAKMQGIEPHTWLKDVLRRIADHPVNKVAELLPHRYKK